MRAKPTAPDGSEIHEISIASSKLTAKILTFGATLRDLRLAGVDHPLVLGFDNPQDYVTEDGCLGAIVGPVANRISNAGFVLDGVHHVLPANDRSGATLHGGPQGCAWLNWRVEQVTARSVRLMLVLPDGHMGFPGPLQLQATYRVKGAELTLELRSKSPTSAVCSLAPHPYFNLDGLPTIDQHQLQVLADQRLPLKNGLPIGPPVSVAGSPYDLRTPSFVPMGCDDHYCLSREREELRTVAHLKTSGVNMRIDSTEAGLQVYDGRFLQVEGRGLGGCSYGARSGLALEPQAWVDAPNQPWQAQMRLLPDQTQTALSRFVFEV